jgi:hypothetical protein
MNQAYWLDPIRRGDLLRAVLEALAGDARVAVEGDVQALDESHLLALSGATRGPCPPFKRQHQPDSAVFVIPLENDGQARLIYHVLAPHGIVSTEIEAIQIEKRGEIEFLAADGFHRECVSVGPAVPEALLRDLMEKGVIQGFYTPAEARKHFGLDDRG